MLSVSFAQIDIGFEASEGYTLGSLDGHTDAYGAWSEFGYGQLHNVSNANPESGGQHYRITNPNRASGGNGIAYTLNSDGYVMAGTFSIDFAPDNPTNLDTTIVGYNTDGTTVFRVGFYPGGHGFDRQIYVEEAREDGSWYLNILGVDYTPGVWSNLRVEFDVPNDTIDYYLNDVYFHSGIRGVVHDGLPLRQIRLQDNGWQSATESFDYDNLRLDAVPEPATVAALALGAVALLRRRRR